MIDELVHIALHRDVGGFLHRLHGEIAGRLEDDRALSADPRNNRWAVFVVMAPAGLTLLAAPTCSASQRLLPTVFRLAFLTRGVIEVIGFNGTL